MHILRKFYPSSMQVLCKFYASSMQVLRTEFLCHCHRCKFYASSTQVLRKFYASSMQVLRKFYASSLQVLRKFYASSMQVLRKFYASSKQVLRKFYAMSWIWDFRNLKVKEKFQRVYYWSSKANCWGLKYNYDRSWNMLRSNRGICLRLCLWFTSSIGWLNEENL